MNKVGQYIDNLIQSGGVKQSEVARAIGAPRQLLSYAVSGRRELSLPFALKLESYFNLPEGFLLKMQVEETIQEYKLQLKRTLAEKLIAMNAFWSYSDVKPDAVSDVELIEKVFIYLDLQDIAKLFELFSSETIHRVWRSGLAVQGDYYYDLNVMIALYYFNIKNPEKYLRRIENEHIKKQLNHA